MLLLTTKVVPSYKSNDKMIIYIISNYRPVTALSVLSKIYEKVMYKRLNNYFVKNNFL